MNDKRGMIVTIVFGAFLLLVGIGFTIGGILIQRTIVICFAAAFTAVWGGIYAYRMVVIARRLKGTKSEKQMKENLANYAFDNLMKEGEDYTVAARVEGAKLVKTIVRWANFAVRGQEIEAMFSIETDKVLACFQMTGKTLIRIQPELTDLVTEMHPELKG